MFLVCFSSVNCSALVLGWNLSRTTLSLLALFCCVLILVLDAQTIVTGGLMWVFVVLGDWLRCFFTLPIFV
jgi:hypothetical protein